MTLPKITHMVEAFGRVGGPPMLVRQIIGSCLRNKYQFSVLSYEISGINPAAVIRIRKQLIQLQPDLVHVHGLKPDGFHAVLAAKLAKVPQILVTIHGSTSDADTDYKPLAMKFRRWVVANVLEPSTLRMADAVYCVCDAMKNRHRIQKYAGTRLKDTIYNGIPLRQPAERSLTLRQTFGFTEDNVVLLYTGRIVKDKGLEVLAAAMNQVVASESFRSKVRLLVVGDGHSFDAIRSCFMPLIQSGIVTMTGRRDDIAALNAMADLFVLPSFHENLAFSLLEAMDAGLPIITTSVGGNPEVVVQGDTGLLVAPRDAVALTDAICLLVDNHELRNKMGQAGRERLKCLFLADTVIQKTDLLYQSLLHHTISRNNIES